MICYSGKTAIELMINDTPTEVVVRPADLLLDVLREQLGLTGAKPGCKNGDCGACTILMDGWPVKSCLVLAVEAVGHSLQTVEGLQGKAPVQQAFKDYSAFQCGYCTSGFLMACHALLQQKPDADEYEMESWLESNLCRCTSYAEIRAAVSSLLAEQKHKKEGIPHGSDT